MPPYNIKVGLLQQLNVRPYQWTHHPTSNASKSCSSCHHSKAQIRPYYSCLCQSALGLCQWRIGFIILLLTYKALNRLAPAYLREQLVPYSPWRTLRSRENYQLTSLRCRLENFGKRSFIAATPMLQNDVPLNTKRSPFVDISKARIKTNLFQLAYFMWLFKWVCECCMLSFHAMHHGMNTFSFCWYVTRILTSALVSKGEISAWNICRILKLALYKYRIIIIYYFFQE